MEDVLESELKASFARLYDIVAANHAVGRRSYGASLKPELKRRTNGSFDEGAFGFGSFGAFLRAAASAGVIDLFKAPTGPDWQAVPPGEHPGDGVPGEQDVYRAPTRVRADFWSCIIDWRHGMRRVYHRATDRAYFFAESPQRGERAEDAANRRQFEAGMDEYVEIAPATFETQISWMREFAERVEDTAAREVLLFALGRARPAREFTDALRNKPELLRHWRAERIQRVVQVIAEWAASNGLSIDPFKTVDERRPPLRTAPASAAVRGADIRERLHRAIDRMPESELMRISIPIEYLLGD